MLKSFFAKFLSSSAIAEVAFETVVEPPPAPAPTLGSFVKARQTAEELAKEARIRAEKEAHERRLAAEKIVVDRFLEAVKVSFTHDIMRGMTLPNSVLFPVDGPFNWDRWYRSSVLHSAHSLDNHPHYRSFQAFFDWVQQQKLYVGFFKRDDGRYEVRSWAAPNA